MVIHFFPTKIRELPSIYWGLKALIHARFGLLFDKSPFSGDEWATHRLSHPYIKHLVGQRPFLSDSDERRMAYVYLWTSRTEDFSIITHSQTGLHEKRECLKSPVCHFHNQTKVMSELHLWFYFIFFKDSTLCVCECVEAQARSLACWL